MHQPQDEEEKKQCLFLTLYPARYGTQLACILSCYEHMGWYPTHLYLHPERYSVCEYYSLYLPVPQEKVYSFFTQDMPSPSGPASSTFSVVQVEIVPDTTKQLKWYQIQCVVHS